MVNEGDKETVAWFSAGVSSFVAAYLAKPDRIVFVNVASQHPDTLRFVADAERVLGRPIEIIGDQRYRQSVDEVIVKRRYINGPAGACCTTELKKRVRHEWERQNAHPGMVYVWGCDADERRRAERTAAARKSADARSDCWSTRLETTPSSASARCSRWTRRAAAATQRTRAGISPRWQTSWKD